MNIYLRSRTATGAAQQVHIILESEARPPIHNGNQQKYQNVNTRPILTFREEEALGCIIKLEKILLSPLRLEGIFFFG